MYEFSKKEVRAMFKQTEYGKKTNKWLYISLAVTAFFILLEFVLGFLDGAEIFKLSDNILGFIDALFGVSLVTLCYFDGKRDGAIEQFKRSKVNELK